MTTTDATPTADFVGIEATIEDIKPYRKAEEAARFKIVVSMPFRGHEELMGKLTGQLKNVVFVGFGFMQAPLGFLPDPGPAPSNTIPANPTMAVLQRDGIPYMTDGNGDVVLPHNFKAGRPDRSRCVVCEAPASHEIHSKQALKAREAMSNGHKANPSELAALGAEREAALQDAGTTPHAFVAHAGDNQCGACGQGETDAVHDADLREMPAAAQALINAAQETEAVPSA